MASDSFAGELMDRATFERLDNAFNRAMDLNAEDRVTLLAALGRSDPELVTRLQAMLQAADGTQDQLRETVRQAADGYAPRVPSQVGPFEVIRPLGSGGMGTVFLCSRGDGQFTQMLAVKRLSDAFGSSALGRERLILERRVLASLQHPNIAQFIDGGADDDGTPYVAMEYIEGASIGQFAQSEKLNLRARVELFLPLCAAVQFAHRNAIIHRDLKPDNVLVDAHGQIKLLDFGIAKLLGEDDGRQASSAHTLAAVMTPHYASPEQVRGERVSQASDIYSLGMMLYELLTGERAYQISTTRPSDIENTVCHQEPVPPSRIGGWRGAAGRDLDAIVLKALHKEPDRRFASAAELADDLRRWLDAKPVLARPDSSAYRLFTFTRRHPFGVTTALSGVVLLTVFAVLMSWQASRLAEQRDRAEHEANVATQSAEFLMDLFTSADPRERNLAELSARDLLDNAAQRLPEAIPDDPLTRARLMQRIGLDFANLGESERSIALLRQALRIREAVTGPDSAESADTRNRLGNVLRNFGQLGEAEKLLKQALVWRTHNGPVNYDLADSYNNLGLLQRDLGRYAEAEENLRESIKLHEQADGQYAAGMAAPLHNLAIVLRNREQLAEAHAATLRSLEIRRRNDAEPALIAHTYSLLGTIEHRMGRLEDAQLNATKSVEIYRTVYGNQSPQITRSMAHLARVQLALGDIEAARQLHEEALAIHRNAQNENSLTAAYSKLIYGEFLLTTGNRAQASKELQRARSTAGHFLQPNSASLQQYDQALRDAAKDLP